MMNRKFVKVKFYRTGKVVVVTTDQESNVNQVMSFICKKFYRTGKVVVVTTDQESNVNQVMSFYSPKDEYDYIICKNDIKSIKAAKVKYAKGEIKEAMAAKKVLDKKIEMLNKILKGGPNG